MADVAMSGTANALTVQMLTWLSGEPRTYAEAIDAWRTSCPRLSVWEDAISDGLVQVVRTPNESRVKLTSRGSELLGGAAASGIA